MSRSYNLGTFLRQTPNELLEEYFDRKGLLAEVEFGDLKKTETGPILDAMAALPKPDRDKVEVELQDIFDLADKAGTGVIVDVAGLLDLGLEDELEAMENHYHRAMWLFLNRTQAGEDMFYTCWLLAQMKSLSFTRSKRCNGLPTGVEPHHDEATRAQMADAIKAHYRAQGRGHECTVAYQLRPNPDRHCYFGFPEDYSTSELQYDSGELRRQTRKSVFEICFVYRPDDGVLELSAPGGKKDAEVLQEIFCRLALGLPRVPPPVARPYELNGLKNPRFSFPTDPAEGVEAVDLVAMRINEVGNKRRRLTFEQDPNAPESLHQWIKRSLDAENVPWTNIDVNQARFRLTFRDKPAMGKKPTLTFTVTTPDSTSLKDGQRDQVAKRCLAKWKLAR